MEITPSRLLEVPHTKPGWWAVGLAIASILLVPAWSFLPGGAWAGFICGLAGTVTGLIALIRHRERSWAVWLTLLPGLNVIVFLLAEIFIPH